MRAMLRWGLETIHRSLTPWASVAPIARRLVEKTDELLLSTGLPALQIDAQAHARHGKAVSNDFAGRLFTFKSLVQQDNSVNTRMRAIGKPAQADVRTEIPVEAGHFFGNHVPQLKLPDAGRVDDMPPSDRGSNCAADVV